MKTAFVFFSLIVFVNLTADAAQGRIFRRPTAPVETQKTTASPKVQPADAKVDANYPYSEIGKVYDTVLDTLASNYFKNYPDLDKEHSAALRAFIAKGCPREEFIKMMVRDKNIAVFDRAKSDIAYRSTKEFQDSFTVVTTVSVRMASLMMRGQCNIYVAKYLAKDPIRTELFGMASTDGERQYVAWVHGEVTAEEFQKKVGNKYETQPGDRFFGFSSPPETWEKLAGRQGFLQVRDRKIIKSIVTALN